MADYESVLVVKQEVFVFKIPPRTTNRGYRAADWNLQTPDWTGRMRLVAKGTECVLKLEDKTTGELFAKCPIDKYPGIAVEAVADSSRYFVLRIQDDGGRSAFIGFGFADRGDSFDLNVALQDHFKWVEKTEKFEEEEKQENKPQLDLSFKEGQTITINMKFGQKSSGTSRPRAKATNPGSILLPPPPAGNAMKIAPPPGRNISPTDNVPKEKETTDDISPPTTSASGTLDLLLDLDPLAAPTAPEPVRNEVPDFWNDFTTAGPTATNASSNNSQENSSSGNWVQF